MTLPSALPPVSVPTTPKRQLPSGACDAHVHMVGHDAHFPLWKNRVEDPASGDLDHWLTLFETHLDTLGLDRCVIVHSILYGGDNRITLEAVRRLGPARARAVCLVPDDVDDATLDVLADAGTKAVRLNYVHGGILSWEGARAMAPRLAERGMHIQMLLHTHDHMLELAEDMRRCPVPVVIDHIGWPDMARGVDEPGFEALLALMQDGHVYTKLSAPYRMTDAPYDTAAAYFDALLAANSERCLWGSDWPHLMLADAKQPDAGVLLNHALARMTDAQIAQIYMNTPQQLFDFR